MILISQTIVKEAALFETASSSPKNKYFFIAYYPYPKSCIYKLNSRNIQYNLSYKYYQGSKVRILQFCQDEPVQNLDNTCSENEQDMSNLCTSHVQNMGTYIYINNKTINSFLNRKKNQKYIFKNIFISPTLEQVLKFFTLKNCDQSAAKNILNYYECCGWKISGKTPIVNWQAAAQNWINHIPKSTKPLSQHQRRVDNLNAPTKNN